MRTDRRSFLSGAASAACLFAARPGAAIPCATRLGVVSDTHVTGPESVAELVAAFRFLRDRGVDAVLHCGDVTDAGTLDQLDAFARAWRMVFGDGTPLVVSLGNRDMMDSRSIPDSVRAASKGCAVRDDPRVAFRTALGTDIGDGVHAVRVGGVWAVAAAWKREGGLEAFFMDHPEIAASGLPVVVLQHRHHQGTVYGGSLPDWAVGDASSTRWMEMFPDFVSFSGHSHFTCMRDDAVSEGMFTAIAAGCYCLADASPAAGRQVSVLTFAGGSAVLERHDLRTGASIRTALASRRPPTALDAGEGFVFMQWNLGHFCFGRGCDTAISADAAAARGAAFRAEIARHAPDVIGMCEYSACFAKDGSASRDRMLSGFAHVDAGPQHGYQCNAVASRAAVLRRVACSPYRRHVQNTYYLAAEVEVFGKRAVIVQTHLDLGDAAVREGQIGMILRDFATTPRLVVSGDFNVSSEAEFGRFASAGFSAANGAAFGRFPTHRRRKEGFTPAIDNVFVKGLGVSGACVGDYALSLSDHRPLVVRLKP